MDSDQKIIEDSGKDRKKVKKRVLKIKPVKIRKPILKPKVNNLKLKTKTLFKRFIDKTEFIKNLILYAIAYGIPINYMLWGIWGTEFSIFRFPAYGILFYLIKEELPRIWMRFFPRR